jgi:hypothetical protein
MTKLTLRRWGLPPPLKTQRKAWPTAASTGGMTSVLRITDPYHAEFILHVKMLKLTNLICVNVPRRSKENLRPLSRIWGSHGDEYEDGCLLGCSAVITHRPDNGGSKVLWNVGKLLPGYTALQTRRQPSSLRPLFFKCFNLYGEVSSNNK